VHLFRGIPGGRRRLRRGRASAGRPEGGGGAGALGRGTGARTKVAVPGAPACGWRDRRRHDSTDWQKAVRDAHAACWADLRRGRRSGLILVALKKGFRLGELIGLQWADLDLQHAKQGAPSPVRPLRILPAGRPATHRWDDQAPAPAGAALGGHQPPRGLHRVARLEAHLRQSSRDARRSLQGHLGVDGARDHRNDHQVRPPVVRSGGVTVHGVATFEKRNDLKRLQFVV